MMNVKEVNYVGGGKLGDFINLLWVAFRKHQLLGQEANIYITGDHAHGGDSFSRSLLQTYCEFIPILKQQRFIKRFEVLEALPAEDKDKLLQNEHVNLNTWRQHVNLAMDWMKLMSFSYKLPLAPVTGGWLTWTPRNPKYADKVVIHRSAIRANTPTFPWDDILRHNKCVFITCNPKEADALPWRDRVEVDIQYTLADMFTAIASAKFFIGNQSSPLTIASALGRPCLVEMDVYWGHTYKQNQMCNGEMFWYYSPSEYYMNGIHKYINLSSVI